MLKIAVACALGATFSFLGTVGFADDALGRFAAGAITNPPRIS
jgi:hypothetical protein